jgi:hypothetical protein
VEGIFLLNALMHIAKTEKIFIKMQKIANSIVGGSEIICKQIKNISKNVHILGFKYPSSEGYF